VEFSRGDAAKRNALYPVLFRQFQARPITGGEQFLIFLRQFPHDDRSYRMQDVFAWKIESRRDLRPAGRLLVSLLLHKLRANVSQLDPRVGVDAVRYSYPNHTWRQHLLRS